MTTIAIVPDDPQAAPIRFRAMAGQLQSIGATVGEAVDALRAQLGGPDETMLIVVQPMRPDSLFTAAQQQRMAELMAHWRAARDAGIAISAEDQEELDSLVEAELRAATARSAALGRHLPS
jgi:hypothetical protein